MRWLAKSWTAPKASQTDKSEADGFRLIVCTGERMESLITRLYATPGARTTTFDVQHAKGLSNEFRCYANFECGDWTWA